MPSLKDTNINASFFPSKGDFIENADGPAMRDLSDDDETAVPSTQVSTRRNSLSEKDDLKKKKSQKKTPQTTTGPRGGKIILVKFDDNDPEDPMNWSVGRKWFTTFMLCMMTCFIGLSTSAYSNTIDSMTAEYGVSSELGQLGMFTFNFACALAPLFLAPLCELVGRRQIYLSAYFCFVLCFLFLALGQNIATQIVGRLFSGLFGSCGTILVGGTLADIWDTKDRSVPMSCFTFVAIFGTIAAPTYCGYIDMYAGWRWIEWVHMIASGLLLIVEFAFFKETRGAKILMDRAKALRKEQGDDRIRAPAELESESVKDLLKKSSSRAIMLLIHEPVVLAFGLWIGLAWGITFLFLSVIPLTFAGNHGWSEGNAGLPYIALIIGCFIGFGTGLWADKKYAQVQADNGGVAIPEYRLYGSLFFTPFLPIGLFIFAFTQYAEVHWIAPIIALVPIILGIYSIFLAVYNYTADSYGELSSSAIAGQGFIRNTFGAVTPLFATYMFKGMGYQYAGLLLAMLTLLMAPLPFLLFKYGARIRASSDYASATTGAKPTRKSKQAGDLSESNLSTPMTMKATNEKNV